MSAQRFRGSSRGFCALLVILPGSMLAQATPRAPIDRGSVLVGGGGSLSRVRQELGSGDSKTVRTVTQLDLRPNLLYFVAPRVAVGGQLGYSHTSGDGGSSSAWALGPAARVYFGDRRAKILPYAGASVMRERSTVDAGLSTGSVDFRSWAYEAVGGLTWMVSSQVGIVGEGFANRTKRDTEAQAAQGTAITAFGVRFGFAAFIF